MRRSIPAAALALLLPAVPVDAQSWQRLAEMQYLQRPIGAPLRVQSAAAIQCPMPVAVPEHRKDMPVAHPDSTTTGHILVVRPGCENPLGPRTTELRPAPAIAPRAKVEKDSVTSLRGPWFRRQPPPDTSRRPPGT